eukprot:1177043-Prorocentrum_minimum.AAC.1
MQRKTNFRKCRPRSAVGIVRSSYERVRGRKVAGKDVNKPPSHSGSGCSGEASYVQVLRTGPVNTHDYVKTSAKGGYATGTANVINSWSDLDVAYERVSKRVLLPPLFVASYIQSTRFPSV